MEQDHNSVHMKCCLSSSPSRRIIIAQPYQCKINDLVYYSGFLLVLVLQVFYVSVMLQAHNDV